MQHAGPPYRLRLVQWRHEEQIKSEMLRLGVDPGGVAIMAPKAQHYIVYVSGIGPKAANILKQEILARGGDAAVSWKVANFVPEPTDLLLFGTLSGLRSLAKKLRRQPKEFKLPELGLELSQVLDGARRPGGQLAPLELAGQTLPLGEKTCWVAPVPAGSGEAGAAARCLVQAGADMVAVELCDMAHSGAAGALVRELRSAVAAPVVAVWDGEPQQTLEAALEAGAAAVYLRSGRLSAPALAAVAAGGAGLWVGPDGAYNGGDLMTELYGSVIQHVEQAVAAGVAWPRLAVHGGRFAASPQQEQELAGRAGELRSTGRPVLVNLDAQRDWAGAGAPRLALASVAVQQGADLVYSGHAEGMRAALDLTDRLLRRRPPAQVDRAAAT